MMGADCTEFLTRLRVILPYFREVFQDKFGTYDGKVTKKNALLSF